MKRKPLISGLIIASLLLTTIPSFAQSSNPIGVMINNTPVTFTNDSGYPFKDENNRVQVPFRQTMQAIGCNVDWNQETQTAIAEKDGIRVEVPIGQNYILKNGQQITNDTVAQIKDTKTYLPIRVVLESFGFDVDWDDATRHVKATDEEIFADLSYEEFKSLLTLRLESGEKQKENSKSAQLYHYEFSFKSNLKSDVFLSSWNEFHRKNDEEYLRKLLEEYIPLAPFNVVVVHIEHNRKEVTCIGDW